MREEHLPSLDLPRRKNLIEDYTGVNLKNEDLVSYVLYSILGFCYCILFVGKRVTAKDTNVNYINSY
jgi:hypothetical protein